MTCDDAVEILAGMETGEASSPELASHLASCTSCRTRAESFSSLDALARRAVPEAPARRRLPLLRWAAALLLAAAGLAVFWKKAEPPSAVPAAPSRQEASLETDGEASLTGRTLVLRSGACWLDTRVPVDLPAFGVRFEAGTEAEVRLLTPAKTAFSLLEDAWAGEAGQVLVSVVSGSAEAGGLRIPAGSRVLLPGGRLEPLDPAPIDAWRARRLASGKTGAERTLKDAEFASFEGGSSFSAEVRAVKGYVVLRYPAGETTLGNLGAWKDGAWHRLGVAWRGSGTEVFLDGRRILKLPRAAGAGIPGIGSRGGSLVLR